MNDKHHPGGFDDQRFQKGELKGLWLLLLLLSFGGRQPQVSFVGNFGLESLQPWPEKHPAALEVMA